MTSKTRLNSNSLLVNLTMLGGLGVFGLGLLLLVLWQVGNPPDPDIKHLAVYAIFAGAFVEVAVIARAIVLKATRNLPKRAR